MTIERSQTTMTRVLLQGHRFGETNQDSYEDWQTYTAILATTEPRYTSVEFTFTQKQFTPTAYRYNHTNNVIYVQVSVCIHDRTTIWCNIPQKPTALQILSWNTIRIPTEKVELTGIQVVTLNDNKQTVIYTGYNFTIKLLLYTYLYIIVNNKDMTILRGDLNTKHIRLTEITWKISPAHSRNHRFTRMTHYPPVQLRSNQLPRETKGKVEKPETTNGKSSLTASSKEIQTNPRYGK